MISHDCRFIRMRRVWTNHSGGKKMVRLVLSKKIHVTHEKRSHANRPIPWKSAPVHQTSCVVIFQLAKKFRERTALTFYPEAAAKWEVAPSYCYNAAQVLTYLTISTEYFSMHPSGESFRCRCGMYFLTLANQSWNNRWNWIWNIWTPSFIFTLITLVCLLSSLTHAK